MNLPEIITHAEQQLADPDADTRALAEGLLVTIKELQGQYAIVAEFLGTDNLGEHHQDRLAALPKRRQPNPAGDRSPSRFVKQARAKRDMAAWLKSLDDGRGQTP